jgi:hypothetical protein
LNFCIKPNCPNVNKYYCSQCVTEEKHDHITKYTQNLVNEEAIKWQPLLLKIKELYGTAAEKFEPHAELVKYLESLAVAAEEERKGGDPQPQERKLIHRDLTRLKDLSSDFE